ncbi:hypothetical protein QN395_17175 [Undibacterium sp. RTI2.2]|uniref:hypothetical protein n=1 Tax=Undibacterium sp. 5I1 TaxID=3048590 RepID=UPI002B2362E9|nr:hypothetical protein [Undibacterium sp. 5I1]MEB0118228.1 hypothetical protein [Undibacterium sp. RTI2.2]
MDDSYDSYQFVSKLLELMRMATMMLSPEYLGEMQGVIKDESVPLFNIKRKEN